jgi:hypothetical protein
MYMYYVDGATPPGKSGVGFSAWSYPKYV